jgi:hypothetical protein
MITIFPEKRHGRLHDLIPTLGDQFRLFDIGQNFAHDFSPTAGTSPAFAGVTRFEGLGSGSSSRRKPESRMMEK